jgi:NAD+ diphosphatase
MERTGAKRMGNAAVDTTPLSVYLPFNSACLGTDFVPAKKAEATPDREGHWLIVQDQTLLVPSDDAVIHLPSGPLPDAFDGLVTEPICLGTLKGSPCWVAGFPKDAAVPSGFRRETIVPMQGTKLPDDLLSLGGMASQALYWQSTSGHCPRCGEATLRIEGEWGKRCPRCHYEHFPHLHPAVIILIRDVDRCLLARKAGWAPGRYALVAGFVDNGECLESTVHREVKEEVGVEVTDIQYVGSQNWPFPSQLMVGFVARYAGGEIAIDHEELEDARWFPCDKLPNSPSRHSIAGFIIANYAKPAPRP